MAKRKLCVFWAHLRYFVRGVVFFISDIGTVGLVVGPIVYVGDE